MVIRQVIAKEKVHSHTGGEIEYQEPHQPGKGPFVPHGNVLCVRS